MIEKYNKLIEIIDNTLKVATETMKTVKEKEKFQASIDKLLDLRLDVSNEIKNVEL